MEQRQDKPMMDKNNQKLDYFEGKPDPNKEKRVQLRNALGRFEKVWSDEDILKFGEDLLLWLEEPTVYDDTKIGNKIVRKCNYSVGQFFAERYVHEDVIYDFRKRLPAFAKIMQIALHRQKEKMIQLAAEGVLKERTVQFVLENNFGMRSKTECDVTSAGQPIQGNVSPVLINITPIPTITPNAQPAIEAEISTPNPLLDMFLE